LWHLAEAGEGLHFAIVTILIKRYEDGFKMCDARVESRLRPILEVVKLRVLEGNGEILAVMGAYGKPTAVLYTCVYLTSKLKTLTPL
jgi:hypothetical protein